MSATVETGTRPLPALGPNRRLKLPKQAERTLGNGLTVIAVRRSAIPLVELRLWMPFGRTHLARGGMLAQTLLSGTETHTATQLAAELQKVGGGLSAGIDPDRLMLSGAGLVTGLDRMLELLADVLTGATYPADWVETERDRLVDRIQVAQSQPAHLARTALLKRIYGRHPYAVQTPEPDQVRAVKPPVLRRLHAERVHPAGAVLVLVGDVQPERALDAAERALSGWTGEGQPAELPPAPPLEPGPLLLVDRPGSVQSSLRIALPAVPRTHPDHAALQLANLVFGGYFSSRWVENIREDKGYTYGPHSLVEHSVAGSVLVAAAEVATEVTAPALLETMYELGRLAALPPKPDELEQARQYALGTLQLGASTQAGLASLTSAYAGNGLRLDFLAEHAARLAAATVDDVAAAAARYLAPALAVTVVLGDAERVADSLATLTPVRTEST
ncbi:insulinase family protein [Micromonospora terminaliae]|uniref:Insulinase family protein n=1 Tax=Micromonospora terminaliae TaxID=1914461 RepID=A0AAJ3DLZ4_9ACTN|nr:pitrilysin family protein [Micromonospora terminaliae]NES28670.1 insulinase family protein [Micromonospora terminaliae]QGL49290.1 insulinase family protein [Micromonospora terminaliae]